MSPVPREVEPAERPCLLLERAGRLGLAHVQCRGDVAEGWRRYGRVFLEQHYASRETCVVCRLRISQLAVDPPDAQ